MIEKNRKFFENILKKGILIQKIDIKLNKKIYIIVVNIS
jgi:hypothetical protein